MTVHLHTHVYPPVRVGSLRSVHLRIQMRRFLRPLKEPYEPVYPSEFQESHIGRAA